MATIFGKPESSNPTVQQENEDAGLLRQRLAEQEESALFTAIPPFPNNIMFEISNGCNHKCAFCYNHKMKRKPGNIDPDLMKFLVVDAYKYGAREIGFATTGEPLLNPLLFDYVKLAKDTGYTYTYFSTNGAKLNPERVEKIFSSGLDSIKFSINAGTPESYSEIHGRDNFSHVIEMVKLVDQRRKELKSKLKLMATFIITEKNRNEQENLKCLIEDIVDDLAFFEDTEAVGPTNSMNTPLPCSMLFNRLHVTREGYLSTCCVDYENQLLVADLNKVSLLEAWQSEAFREFRKCHINGNIEGTLCAVCASRLLLPYKPLTNVGLSENTESVFRINTKS